MRFNILPLERVPFTKYSYVSSRRAFLLRKKKKKEGGRGDKKMRTNQKHLVVLITSLSVYQNQVLRIITKSVLAAF